MTSIDSKLPITRGKSLVPAIPLRPRQNLMQRGAPSGPDLVLPGTLHMDLTRLENQRTRATNGDVIRVFSVPERVFFGLFEVQKQVRATELPEVLERGVPVTVHWARMELVQDVISKRYLMHPTVLPGTQRVASLEELAALLKSR